MLSLDTRENHSKRKWVPDWLAKAHEFIDSSIRKGTHSAFKKSLERNVHATIGVILSSIALYAEECIIPRLVPVRKDVLSKATP